jgi:integrase
MAKQLTAAAVKKYRSGRVRREIPDGGCPGLYVVIQASGHRSWAMRFRRPSGKSAKLTLGPVDLSGKESESDPVFGMPLTLASARRLAADIHRQRAMGRDAVADYEASKRRQRSEQETRAKSTFATAARDFIEGHAKRKTRRWQEQARLLGLQPTAKGFEVIRGGMADRWGDKPIAEIDGHDIYGVVDESRRSGVPGLERRSGGLTEARARAMFSCLSKMFAWLVQHQRVDRNPCAGVHRPDTPRARDRVLTDAEIVKFWSAAAAERLEFAALLKLLLLTGCRLNEVAGMARVELSDDGATWNIPGARTKNGRPHVVPLALLAREILAGVAGEGGLVFTTTGDTPISGWSKIKNRMGVAMLEAARKENDDATIPPWRLHDLRRTCATGMAELGIAPHIIEAVLNHISGARAGVAGIYNRALHSAEKRAALERWAVHIQGLVAGQKGKVVKLRRKTQL